MVAAAKKKHVRLSRTSGSDSRHERPNANPQSDDLQSASQVWKDAETTPQPNKPYRGAGQADRVADRGDIAGTAASAYAREVQADAVAKQTQRNSPDPKRKKQQDRGS